jgi:hypothetical protein
VFVVPTAIKSSITKESQFCKYILEEMKPRETDDDVHEKDSKDAGRQEDMFDQESQWN